MDDRTYAPREHAPTPSRPLLGLTVLVVEDSRFASEAMRLLCLKSGARMRRADCIRSARRHLQVYRPSVVIVDLGLPDGSGLDLIRDLAAASPRVSVLLASSGDDGAEGAAIEAGADGFIAKPLRNLTGFQRAVLEHLPKERRPNGPRVASLDEIMPDLIAYRDDMAHMAEVLGDGSDEQIVDYVAQFLHGVARSADDTPLLQAVNALREDRARGQAVGSGLAKVAGMVQERIGERLAI